MTVSFGVAFGSSKLQDIARWARKADDLGFAMVATGDSPAMFTEQYVALTLIALNTSRCKVASFVTNPLTRDPAVACAGISSINQLAEGRAVFGISTGNAGVRALGHTAARLADLEEYVTAVRQLWTASSTTYQGRTLRFTWSRQSVPIYIAAGGPASLRLAGRIADGVFIATGMLPEVVEDSLRYLGEGAKQAGRRLEDVDQWWYVTGSIGPSREAALEQIGPMLASRINLVFRFSLERKGLPKLLQPKMEEMKRRYPVGQHGHEGPRLLKELGLYDYMAERFAIAGTPQDWVTQVRRLASNGAKKLVVAVMGPDQDGFIDALGGEVLPAFK